MVHSKRERKVEETKDRASNKLAFTGTGEYDLYASYVTRLVAKNTEEAANSNSLEELRYYQGMRDAFRAILSLPDVLWPDPDEEKKEIPKSLRTGVGEIPR